MGFFSKKSTNDTNDTNDGITTLKDTIEASDKKRAELEEEILKAKKDFPNEVIASLDETIEAIEKPIKGWFW